MQKTGNKNAYKKICLRQSEKHIFQKLLVFVLRGILWPNLDSVGDSKIIYDNNPICDVIELALHDVTADTTCQNGKCTDNFLHFVL